jgi:hypothetical protein
LITKTLRGIGGNEEGKGRKSVLLHACMLIHWIPLICTITYQVNWLFLFFLSFLFGAGIKPRALHMLGKRCTTKLHPSPLIDF